MVEFVLGALKALVAGVAIGGAALAILLGADPAVVGAVGVVLGPLAVYLTGNKQLGGVQESAEGVPDSEPGRA